ncbi:helix-turn-helix domain-containing protein [Natrialba asiatica]|uniref:Hth DNA binding domain protein n=1 Tax=Natrialba asiatica (strain ATCC 700177 / DSM 12278 / JCM 9576 / FERM P-10747 / NBRC 102637 / 172P1) TaxID=29540 RepID=M0ASF2_NATA1|nr:helix-turn-helix domain-containing protein [Natrialba asiatica]ELZ00878.1 hth DNA binding domain protein [Natrialba asiatica DSM 12278]
MGLVAEFEITCEALPLVEVATATPAATMEVDIQFNHGNRPPFIVHVTRDPADAVEDAFDTSSFVAEYTLIGRAGSTSRYQILPAVGFEAQLGEHIADLSGLRALATTDAIIERICVTPTGWIQRGWFADRDAFAEFSEFWQQNAGFTLRRLTRDGDPEAPGDGLTDPQREALRTAYEMGHYEIPQSASLDDVAAELGITASSLSERLRRAQTRLIETTVGTTWPPLPE